MSEKLEQANIILNKNLLPYDNQKNKGNPSGLRIGFQDVTRRGFMESDIKYLCDLMLAVIRDKNEPRVVRQKIVASIQEFQEIAYGFQSIDEAINYAQLTS